MDRDELAPSDQPSQVVVDKTQRKALPASDGPRLAGHKRPHPLVHAPVHVPMHSGIRG